MQEVFTTGEAAEICGVCSRIIINRFNDGSLKGFFVPPTRKHRRIPIESLREFMIENNIPLQFLRDRNIRPKGTGSRKKADNTEEP